MNTCYNSLQGLTPEIEPQRISNCCTLLIINNADSDADSLPWLIMFLRPPKPPKSTYEAVTNTLDMDTPLLKYNQTSSIVDGKVRESCQFTGFN